MTADMQSRALQNSLERSDCSPGKLRTSSYVIYVDLPSFPNEWLIVHGYTGTYDCVDRKVAAYLRSRETAKVPKPLFGVWEPDELLSDDRWTPSEETLTRLRKRGYLTERSAAEELEFFKEYVGLIHERQLRAPPAYVIMPTYDCNLRCHYCFQDHMRTNPAFRRLLRTMTVEMADRIMGSFPHIEERYHSQTADGCPSRSFTFFGGEPLLAQSRPLVEHIIKRQKQLCKCDFTAVTNGTELDAYEDLLGPEDLSVLQITIDGPPQDHDKRRIYANGSGSFARISKNLSMALDRKARVMVRVNVDRSNVQGLPRLAEVFDAEGWSKRPGFSAYVAPVHDYSPAGLGNGSTRQEFFNSWELGVMLTKLHDEYPRTRVFGEVDGAMKSRARSLFQGRGGDLRSQYCGAHRGMYIFDSFGDIYACWDRTGDDKLRIGKVNDDNSVTLNGVSDMWRSRTVASNPTCSQCRFALNCGGGCAVLAEGSSGTIFSNFCDAFGKRFRVSVAEAYLEHVSSDARDIGKGAASRKESVL